MDNEDYVESEYSEDNEVNGAIEDYEDMDWTKVLPPDTLGEFYSEIKWPSNIQHKECEDSDNLYTSHKSDGDEGVVKFPTYKSGVGNGFHLGMMFINK